MKKKIIVADNAPQAIGAYSQAVMIEGGKLLFVSAQLGLDPATMALINGGVGAEAKQALENIGAILQKAGGSFESVVKTTIYLADISDFAAVNGIYAAFFKSDPPARAAFAVSALPKGARVAIEAIAAF